MSCSKCNQSFDSLTDEGLCADCYAEADDRRLEIVEPARNEHQKDGEVEIDDNAQFSEGNDNGCYVAAWVWVSFPIIAPDIISVPRPRTSRTTSGGWKKCRLGHRV